MEFTGERLMPLVSQDHYAQHLVMYERALEVMPKHGVCLDVACGSGWGTKLISERMPFVVGMDISPEAVEYAESHYAAPNVKYMVGSVLDLPFPNGMFSHVNSVETFEHVPRGAISNLILECYRVLEPGGRFTFSTPDGVRFPYQPASRAQYVGYHCWHYTRDELYTLLRPYFEYGVHISEPWDGNFWVHCVKRG